MDNHYWRFTVSFAEKTASVVWAEKFWNENSSGYWLSVLDPETGEYFTDYDEFFTEAAVKQAAIAFRSEQIVLKTDLRFTGDKEVYKQAVMELFLRAEDGEYLGQYVNSNFYVQDVARILKHPMNMTLDLVDELVEERKLGLNGMILVPYEDYASAFEYWFETTGHKKFTVSDWGYWACAACGKSGEPEDELSPAQVPCVTV